MQNNYGLSGLIDDEGLFYGAIPESAGIWVTDRVFLQDMGDTPWLMFLVPGEWRSGNKTGWKTRLKEIGWTRKPHDKTLLEEFIRLADSPPEKFLSFAKKWGPLWERIKLPYENLPDKDEYLWPESIKVWNLKAKQVKSIVDIASLLCQEEPAPLKYWYWLGFRNEQSHWRKIKGDISGQRYWLGLMITNLMGSANNNIRFEVNWTEENPRLELSTRLGFIHSVWFLLAQAVTKNNIYICDGCGKVYVREKRKPAKGRKNFCPDCSEGGRGSKRLWAANNK